MRRFLSRSRSVPLPPHWESKSSSPPSVDSPPRYNGPAASIAAEDTIDEHSLAPTSISSPSTLLSYDFDTKVSQRPSSIDRDHACRPDEAQQRPCFTLVKSSLNNAFGGCESPRRIVVHDPSLLAVSRELRLLSDTSGDRQSSELELDLLLACLPRLEKHLDGLKATALQSDCGSALHAVGALTSYLRKEHGATLTKIAELTSRGEATFDTLFAIFTPGTVVVVRCAVTGEWRAYDLVSATKVRTPSADVYDLVCESVDVVDDAVHCVCCSMRRSSSSSSPCPTGATFARKPAPVSPTFRRVQCHMLVPYFGGAVRICSLDVYPLKYHPDGGSLEASLVDRGRRWLALQGIHHVGYHGTAMSTLSIGGCKTSAKYEVKGPIVLDRGNFFRMSTDCEIPVGGVTTHEVPSKLEDLMLSPPVLYGFSILDQRWLVFNIEHIQPFKACDSTLSSFQPDASTVMCAPCEETPRPKAQTTPVDERSHAANTLNAVATAARGGEKAVGIPDASHKETVAVAQRFCTEELAAIAASLDKRCTHAFAELNAKYAAESAMHRQTMRLILVATGALFFPTLAVLLYRLLAPPARATRWSGPMHFTIPILSPFSSVIEHESSSFGLRQVAVVIVSSTLFFMFWLRFCVRRK